MNVIINAARKIIALGDPLAAPIDPSLTSVEFLGATSEMAKLGQPGDKTLSAGDTTITVTAPAANAGDLPTLAPVAVTDAQHGNRGGGTLHAVATATTAGFQSAADKTKLDKIGVTSLSSGTAAIPAITLLGSQNVTVTFTKPMSGTAYKYFWNVLGVNLGALTVTEISRTAATITLKLAATVAVSAGGTIQVTAFEEV